MSAFNTAADPAAAAAADAAAAAQAVAQATGSAPAASAPAPVDTQAPATASGIGHNDTPAPALSVAAPAPSHRTSRQLQVKAGPMLKYDTTIDGVLRAFALIVTEDAASDYSSVPTLVYSGSTVKQTTVQAIKLWHYDGQGGAHTFWRFPLTVPLPNGTEQSTVTYQVAPGGVQPKPNQRADSVDATKPQTFTVAGKELNFRWAAHSCNGFSSSINQKEWNGPNPLWDDLLKHHAQQPFHVVNGGGDQIYCDKLAKEPELAEWTKAEDPKKRAKLELTPEIAGCLERFFFTWYCEWFGTGSFSKAIASIPMLNMLDDHDAIDGWGTYDDAWMLSPIFNAIGRRAYHYYLLFQQFVNDEVDGLDEKNHVNKSIILGSVDGPYMPGVKNHSFLSYLGPKQYILQVDCRSERKIEQICTEKTYAHIFERVRSDIPAGVEHLIILLGVPLAYPRMVFLEKALSSKLNPIILLAKGISPGFTNNFNGQVELLDDLNDHWCAAPHKRERNWLVERVQEISYEKRLRSTFLSGDVHAAGVGLFSSYTGAHNPELDPKYMLAVITSAIVNAPPPPPVIGMLNRLAAKKHRSLFYRGTRETMVPIGSKSGEKYIIGSRNWCAITYQTDSSALEFDLRIEKSKGAGETESHAVRAPAPRWEARREHTHLLHLKDFEKRISKHFHHRSDSKTAPVNGAPAVAAAAQ